MSKTRKTIILFSFLVFTKLISAQIWADINFSPNKDANSVVPFVLFSENDSSKLYVGGNFIYTNFVMTHGIVTYDNINGWMPFGTTLPYILDIIKFNNNIYVCGNDGVFKWNGIKWDTIGLNDVGAVSKLFVFNNELYAGGVYNKIDTTISHGLTKWNGTSWTQVGDYKKKCFGTIYDINVFNGELYVFGQLTDTLGLPMNIARFDGQDWHRVTNLFNGGMDAIETSAVYNNELYVGGLFGKYQGSAFNFIAKYNGSSWSDVGINGVTGLFGNSNGQIHKLRVIDGKLYTVGVFSYADNIEAQYISSWDGMKWCGYGNGFDNRITEIVKANDAIFIGGGFWTYNTDSVLRVAKWIGGNFVDTCSSSVGIEYLNNELNFLIYPNPTNGILNISDEENALQDATIQIKNYLSQVVYTNSFTNQIDLSHLSSGMYFLTIQNKDLFKTFKIIRN
jgi:hypothetical protein